MQSMSDRKNRRVLQRRALRRERLDLEEDFAGARAAAEPVRLMMPAMPPASGDCKPPSPKKKSISAEGFAMNVELCGASSAIDCRRENAIVVGARARGRRALYVNSHLAVQTS